MTCKRWPPQELLPVADYLSCVLKIHQNITGIALTGSLARLEPQSHDIDLVVLHNGKIQDGNCAGSEKKLYDVGRYNTRKEERLFMEEFVEKELANRITQITGEIPSNFIFVNQNALWNCEYLESLGKKFWGLSSGLNGFYTAVFCQIPLLLLDPQSVRGELFNHISNLPVEKFDKNFSWTGLPFIKIRHQCSNQACQPQETWEKRQKQIREKKKAQGCTCYNL